MYRAGNRIDLKNSVLPLVGSAEEIKEKIEEKTVAIFKPVRGFGTIVEVFNLTELQQEFPRLSREA